MNYTRELADFVADIRRAEVPEEVARRAKSIVLDGIGCGLYGSRLPWTRILAGVVQRLEPLGGTASIWGSSQLASPVNAALVNGCMIQGCELDDANPVGSFHACAAILPAVFAAAEYVGADKVDGATLLSAIIVGFEIGPRVSICMNGARMISNGWHAPAVVSAFPAAMAAGVVLGLNSQELSHALGIAGTQASGLMAAQYGSMVKRMQCAKNSQSGLYAALLAQQGFTGIENIFEVEYGGFCSTFASSSDQYQLVALTDGIGTRWETLRIAIKRCACLGANQSAINAIEELMNAHPFTADDVERVTVGVTEAQVKHSGWYPYVASGLTAAQMHLGFCVAVQLIEGEVFVEQMTEENVARPDLVDLANRVSVFRNEDREKKGELYRRGADVEIVLKNGAVLRNSVDHYLGSHYRPLSDEQISSKYRRLACTVLSQEKTVGVEELVRGLEQLPGVKSLIDSLCKV